MKTSLRTFLSICAIAAAGSAVATSHTVTVANFQFTPSAFNAQVGDTVVWNWVNGDHTTTSTNVPSGAATWDSPMSSTSTTFRYVITKPGSYTYQCTPHAAFGMTAAFTVASSTGVSTTTTEAGLNIYPNPAQSSLHLKFSGTNTGGELAIVDVSGKVVLAQHINSETEISTVQLAAGNYTARVIAGGVIRSERFSVVR